MAKWTDVSGKTVGMLTAIKYHKDYFKKGASAWECSCSCGSGKSVFVRTGDFNRGGNSCGCLSVAEDLTGMAFGNLTVLERNNEGKWRNSVMWDCLCKCGNKVVTSSAHLKSGHTKGCGCTVFKRGVNDFIWEDDCVGIVLDNKNSITYIDKDDYEKVKHYKWYEGENGYAMSSSYRNDDDGCSTYLHRIIMDAPKHMCVDHINGNILNNRKANLRICTRQQNIWNSVVSKNSKTGHKNVYLLKSGYLCSFMKDGEIFDYRFSNIEDAIEFSKKETMNLYGGYSHENRNHIMEV